MTLRRRIGRIISALFSILGAWLIFKLGEEGLSLVGMILSLSLLLLGLRTLIYYFTMARHMVDGKSILWYAVIILDFGAFTMTISRFQGEAVALYLLFIYAFTGIIDVLRALEARRAEAPSWRLNLLSGLIRISFAGAAAYFGLLQGDMRDLCLIYAAGILYSAVTKLFSAFRKTAIVYIQ